MNEEREISKHFSHWACSFARLYNTYIGTHGFLGNTIYAMTTRERKEFFENTSRG